MSQEERDWLEWLKRAQDGVVTQRYASEQMGVTDRWVRKLLARMKEEGDGVVVHGLRGRVSNRRIEEAVERRALGILQQPEWHDFGPTFASEQLAKHHGLEVSKETLRKWMMGAGLWKSRTRAMRKKHGWRERRSCCGELVQTTNHQLGPSLSVDKQGFEECPGPGYLDPRLDRRARERSALPGGV